MRCKVCGADVPILREFCPNCGAPTDPGLRDRQQLLGQGRQQHPQSERTSGRKGYLIAAAALLGLGGLTIGIIDAESESDDRSEVIDRQLSRGAVTIEADELFKAFRDDPDEAEDRFEDREMVVSGEFVRIVPDGYGSLDLRLATSDPNAQLGIDLADLAVEDGKKLVPGQRVTVSCQGMGSGGDELWVRDCAIQPNAGDGDASETPASEPSDTAGGDRSADSSPEG